MLFFWLRGSANDEGPELVETPPSVSTVNSLALAKRPYVELVPHQNPARCNGVDMSIEDLKNGEEKVEYELEYTTEKLIQGVFGRRDFTAQEEHKPLEFGTCSRGKCKCDDDITGGSLKLSFEGAQDYVLKGDFSVQNVGEQSGVITSRDVRLTLNASSLPKDTDVLVTSTFGLPGELADKVVLGPYGIFIQNAKGMKAPIQATLQSKEVGTGIVQFWDGTAWKKLDATIEGDKASFELEGLGVIVLTE